jgi:PPK2 family polyphosphate:nucleotide phosphotransferase
MQKIGKHPIVKNGEFHLKEVDPNDRCKIPEKELAREMLSKMQKRLSELQEMLYAQSRHSVLVVLQAIDTGGKDGTIRSVFGHLNPQGVRVTSFKAPSTEELAHDYLWRIHKEVPAKGMIGVFNRSHYEDVLVVRVHDVIPKDLAKVRYAQINEFEKYLTENNVHVVKILLHISKDEQKRRLESRLADPSKHWKFSLADTKERVLWNRYMEEFENIVTHCGTKHAPWHVVPANHKWVRDVVVAKILLETLEGLNLTYPKPAEGLEKIKILD